MPTSEDSQDGLHVIIFEKGCLLYEDYNYTEFPFSHWQWKQAPLGFYGIALAHELKPSQIQINRLLNIIDKAHIYLGYPKLWARNDAGFNPEHWVSKVGAVIISEQEPKVINQPLIPSEIYTYLDYIFTKCFEISGISQQTASAKKEKGLTSGVAIQAVADIQSDRLSIPSIGFEFFFLDSAKRSIEQMKELFEENDDEYQVRVVQGGKAVMIDWNDVNLVDDAFTLRVEPINSMPKLYPGKLDYVNMLLQAGTIAPYQFSRLLSNPDVDSVLSPQEASVNYITKCLEQILDGRSYRAA